MESGDCLDCSLQLASLVRDAGRPYSALDTKMPCHRDPSRSHREVVDLRPERSILRLGRGLRQLKYASMSHGDYLTRMDPMAIRSRVSRYAFAPERREPKFRGLWHSATFHLHPTPLGPPAGCCFHPSETPGDPPVPMLGSSWEVVDH